VAPRRVGLPNASFKHEVSIADADFKFAVMSYDVGFEKYSLSILCYAKPRPLQFSSRPDRRIFEAAEDMLEDLLPEAAKTTKLEKLYVGDDVDKDIKGAAAAGWHSLMLHQAKENTRNFGSHSQPRWQVQIKSGEWVDILRTFKELGQWAPRDAEENITYDIPLHPYEFKKREQVADWKQTKADVQEAWREKQRREAVAAVQRREERWKIQTSSDELESPLDKFPTHAIGQDTAWLEEEEGANKGSTITPGSERS
jgi:hypothetical protein